MRWRSEGVCSSSTIRRRLGVAGIGAHGKPKPHAKVVPWEMEKITLNAGALSCMVCRHQLEGLSG
jgi:hypothetical protein